MVSSPNNSEEVDSELLQFKDKLHTIVDQADVLLSSQAKSERVVVVL